MNKEDYEQACEAISDLYLKGLLSEKEYVTLYTRASKWAEII